MAEGNTKMTPLVEIHDGVMEFPGVKVSLDQVNFTLMPGECHALVGKMAQVNLHCQSVLQAKIK